MKCLHWLLLLLFISCGKNNGSLNNFNVSFYAKLNQQSSFYKDHKIKKIEVYSYEIPETDTQYAYVYSPTILMSKLNECKIELDSLVEFDEMGRRIRHIHFYRERPNTEKNKQYESVYEYNRNDNLVKINDDSIACFNSRNNIVSTKNGRYTYHSWGVEFISDEKIGFPGDEGQPKLMESYYLDEQQRVSRKSYHRNFKIHEVGSITYEYNEDGLISTETEDVRNDIIREKADEVRTFVTKYEYNQWKKLTKIHTTYGDWLDEIVENSYDSRGNLILQSHSRHWHTKEYGSREYFNYTEYRYNNRNEPIQLTEYFIDKGDTVVANRNIYKYVYY
jgi:hypothetical protein